LVSKFVFGLALISSKGGLLLVLPAFTATILGTYSLVRSWFPDEGMLDDSDVMASYQQQSESARTWKMWVFACGTGAINSILLVICYWYLAG
jgi:hypothetical protein